MKIAVLTKISFLLMISLISGCTEKRKILPEDLSVNEFPAVTEPKNSITQRINVAESIIVWRGTKLGGIRGHEGTLEFEKGDVFLKDNEVVGGYFIINMKSLEVTDIPDTQATAKNNLKKHLKSEFKTAQFPRSTFEITGVTYTGPQELQASGNLTIKGITKNIQVPLRIEPLEGTGKELTTTLRLDRSDWNIGENGSWLEKRVVDNTFSIQISIIF